MFSDNFRLVTKHGSRRMAGLVAENVASQTTQGFELAVAENISCQTQSKPYVWQLMFSDNFRRRLSMVPAVWRD
jgi:hypothetical protein